MVDNKKIVLIIFSLLILVAGAVFVARNFINQVPDFAVKDEETIKKIEFKSDKGVVSLEKKNEIWVLNGVGVARKDAVKALLKTLTNIEIKSPIKKEKLNSILSGNGIETVQVRISGSLKQLKKYTVYKVSSNPYGNIMTKGKKESSYINHLPGYSGDIGVFYTTRLNYWKPHILFDYNIGDISSVELIKGDDPINSYTISRNESGSFILGDVDGEALKSADPGQVTRYLSYFHNIGFEKYVEPESGIFTEKILQSQALYTIRVKNVQGDVKVVKIYPVFHEESLTETDKNYAYASVSGENELVLVKYFALDPILKSLDYFFK